MTDKPRYLSMIDWKNKDLPYVSVKLLLRRGLSAKGYLAPYQAEQFLVVID